MTVHKITIDNVLMVSGIAGKAPLLYVSSLLAQWFAYGTTVRGMFACLSHICFKFTGS